VDWTPACHNLAFFASSVPSPGFLALPCLAFPSLLARENRQTQGQGSPEGLPRIMSAPWRHRDRDRTGGARGGEARGAPRTVCLRRVLWCESRLRGVRVGGRRRGHSGREGTDSLAATVISVAPAGPARNTVLEMRSHELSAGGGDRCMSRGTISCGAGCLSRRVITVGFATDVHPHDSMSPLCQSSRVRPWRPLCPLSVACGCWCPLRCCGSAAPSRRRWQRPPTSSPWRSTPSFRRPQATHPPTVNKQTSMRTSTAFMRAPCFPAHQFHLTVLHHQRMHCAHVDSCSNARSTG
jgi:hypothetical protein